jgi:hypothetical protein
VSLLAWVVALVVIARTILCVVHTKLERAYIRPMRTSVNVIVGYSADENPAAGHMPHHFATARLNVPYCGLNGIVTPGSQVSYTLRRVWNTSFEPKQGMAVGIVLTLLDFGLRSAYRLPSKKNPIFNCRACVAPLFRASMPTMTVPEA